MGIKTVLDLAGTDIRLSVNILMSCSKERCVNCAVTLFATGRVCTDEAGNYLFPLFGERITDYTSMRQAICSYAAGRRKNFAVSINIVGLFPRL